MIPKNIHQIWLGDKRIPRHIIDYMSEIRLMHPTYEYYFWTDDNIPSLPSPLKEVFDSLEHPAMKSDLLRVYVLYLYGGVYLDVDYKLLTHLDNLECFDDGDAYLIYPESKEIDNINNSILISSAKGQFISYMLKRIKHEKQWLGPHFYAETLYGYLKMKNNSSYKQIIEKCDSNNIGHISEIKLNQEIITHKFMASWYPNSEWNKKFESNDYA